MLKKCQIVVLGSRSVGKSSLGVQFIDSSFSGVYYPTIESTWKTSITYRGAPFECHITDTAGLDSYTPINPKYAIGTHGYIFVYAIDSQDSFEMVTILHNKILDFCGVGQIPGVIVGNKSDLSARRRVSSFQGRKLASELNCAWVETSCKENVNIAECFNLCLREVEQNRMNRQSSYHIHRSLGWLPSGTMIHTQADAIDADSASASTEPIVSASGSPTTPADYSLFAWFIAPIRWFSSRKLPSDVQPSPLHDSYQEEGSGRPSESLLTSILANPPQPISRPRTVLTGEGLNASEDQSATLRGSAPPFLHILRPSSQGPWSQRTFVGESVLPKEGDESLLALLSNEESASDAVQCFLKIVHGQKGRSVEGSKPGNSVVTLHNIFSVLAHDKVACKPILALTGDDAQTVLNALQWLLDCPKLHMLDNSDSGLLKLLLRLSKRSGLYPQCLTLKDIVREDEFAITAGHFGEIWKGRFRGRAVCLKMVKVYQQSQIDHLLKVFSKEAILWSQLTHRNVLPFYGIYHLGDEYSRICLVSPWMGNGNVRDYLSNHPDVDRLLLVKDVGAGLSYLHQQGIIHGDLKGVNILVSNSGRSCLADFGLSNLVDSEILRWTSTQSTGHVGGTVRWQGPELFNPEDESAKPTRQSDIYSFACVCYEIFTNEVPFYEVFRESTVIANVMAGKQPSKPDMYSAPYLRWGLTDAVWEMMEACWSRIPDARPTIQQIIYSQPLDVVVDQRPDDIEDQFSPREFRNAMYGTAENESKSSSWWPTSGWFHQPPGRPR